MFRRLAFLRMFIAAFAIFYVGASTSAASACVMTELSMPACGSVTSDCDSHKSHDCQLACGAMCAAVEPSIVAVTVTKPVAQTFSDGRQPALPAGFSGPDPPPPRMG